MNDANYLQLEKLGTCQPDEFINLAKLRIFNRDFYRWIETFFSEAEVNSDTPKIKGELLLRLKVVILLQDILFSNKNLDDNDLAILKNYLQVLEKNNVLVVQYEICVLALEKIDKTQYPLDWAIICAQKSRLELRSQAEASETKWDEIIGNLSECAKIFKSTNSNSYWLITQIDLGAAYFLRASNEKSMDYEATINLLEPLIIILPGTTQSDIMIPIMHLLGKTYRERIVGDKSENVETAIEFLEIVTRSYWEMGERQNRLKALFDLALAYSIRSSGDSLQNHEKYMSLLTQIIDSGRKFAGDELWATACHNLGAAIVASNTCTNDDLEEANSYYERALSVYTSNDFPLKRGQTLAASASVYLDITDRNNMTNLQTAIDFFQEAAALFTNVFADTELAECYNKLGVAYSKLPISSQVTSQALKCFDLAENIYIAQNEYRGLASILLNRAITVFYSSTSNDTFDSAVNALTESFELNRQIGDKQAEIGVLIQLGSVLVQNTSLNKYENVTKGVSYIRSALKELTPENNFHQWFTASINLAYGLLELNTVDRVNRLEESITLFNDLIDKTDPRHHPFEWAQAHNGACMAYSHRILGDPVENFEYAIGHGLKALEFFSPDGNPIEWNMVNLNIADCYINAPFGSAQQNFSSALTCLNTVEKFYKRETYPKEYARLNLNFGLLYSRNRNPAHLLLAIDYYKVALSTAQEIGEMEFVAKVYLNLGNAYSFLAEIEQLDVNVVTAVKNIEEALNIYSRDISSREWALCQLNLGSTYSLMRESKGNFEKAEMAFLSALDVFSKSSFPFYWQTTIIQLQSLYFRYSAFEDALRIGFEVLNSLDEFIHTAVSDVSKIFYMRDIPKIGENMAYMLAEEGKFRDAIYVLDSVRARSISEDVLGMNIDLTKLDDQEKSNIFQTLQSIRSRETKLHQENWFSGYVNVSNSNLIGFHKENLYQYIDKLKKEKPELEYSRHFAVEDLSSYLGTSSCLIIPVITSLGSKVFFISNKNGGVNLDVISINGFSTNSLTNIFVGTKDLPGLLTFYRDYSENKYNHTKNDWHNLIDGSAEVFWNEFFCYVNKYITDYGFKKIYIIPQGVLNLLPFQAIWHMDSGKRIYLVDEFELVTIPTLAMYLALNRKAETTKNSNITRALGIINPTKDLDFAYEEGEALRKIFPSAKILSGEANQRKIFFESYSEYSHMHFACHGFYDWENPWNSGLMIAKNDVLATHEILSKLNLDNCKLVVLSACETGMVDIENPNEYIGFASSFMRVGVPSLITARWRIDDQATSLLFQKFYEFHIEMKLSPSEAMRKAQIWLKDLQYGDIPTPQNENTRMNEEEYSEFVAGVKGNIDSLKPYSHPFYWAAFNFIGL